MFLLGIIKCWVWPVDWAADHLAVTCQVASASGQPLGTLHTRCRPPVSQRMGDGDYWSWPRPLNSRGSHIVGSWHHPGHLGCRWHITITRSHTENALNSSFSWEHQMNDVKEVFRIWFHHFDNRPLYCVPVFRWPQMAGLLSGLIGINESRTDHHHSGTLSPSLVTRCLCKHGH